MEDIIKGLIELAKGSKEIGLLCIVFLVVVYFLVKQLMKQMKWREEWLERFVKCIGENTQAMQEGAQAIGETRDTVAEMDTDLHDVLRKMETDAEVEARVAAELERRSHGRRDR